MRPRSRGVYRNWVSDQTWGDCRVVSPTGSGVDEVPSPICGECRSDGESGESPMSGNGGDVVGDRYSK